MKPLTFEQWKKIRKIKGRSTKRADYDFYRKLERWNRVEIPKIIKRMRAERA